MTNLEDKIDLISILDVLVKNIKIIFIAILIGLIVAFIYDNQRNPQYSAKVEIFTISDVDELELAEYAYLVDSNVTELNEFEDMEQVTFVEKFNPIKLREKFVTYFLSSGIVKNNFFNSYNLTDDYNINVKDKFNIEKSVTPNDIKYFLVFKTRNKNKDLDILERSVNEINAQIFDDIKIYGVTLTRVLELFKERKIKKLNDDLRYLDKSYDLKLERQKSFLNEHLSIAKSLGLEMTNSNYISSIEEAIFGREYGEFEENYLDKMILPYYLRGYKAIEQEILMLEKRTKDRIELFDPEYAIVKTELNNMSSSINLTEKEINKLLDKIKNFESVKVDLNQLKYKQTLPTALLYTIIIALSVFFSFLFVLVRQSYQDYKNK